MNLTFNIIMIVTLYPVLLILYFVTKGTCKPNGNIVLGVTVPNEFLEDKEVLNICEGCKKKLKRNTLLSAVIPIVTFLIPYFSINFSIWMGWLLAIIVAIALPYVRSNKKLLALKKERQYQKEDVGNIVDDDAYWIYGMFYYNKNDKHKMVDKRYGIGTTMNMATKCGKGLGIFSGLAILSVPVICIWLIFLEITPINLNIDNEKITATQLNTDYVIELDNIVDIKLILELPHESKVNGTNTDNLEKGTFKVKDYGKCELFLNPKNSEFIVITTDDTTYIFTDKDDVGTMEIYQEMLSKRENNK